MDIRRALAAGGAVLATLTASACGGSTIATVIATGHPAKAAVADLVRSPPTPAAPAISPCVEGKLPPAASRLTSEKDYPAIQTRLGVVPATVRPKVSAATAFAHLGYYQPGTGSCGLAEVLAYWSSDSPGTVPPTCVPNGTSPWSPPANCPVTPIYPHVLAWVFTWRSDCDSLGGPAPLVGASPRPVPSWPPLACMTITFVSAATGARSDYLTITAATP